MTAKFFDCVKIGTNTNTFCDGVWQFGSLESLLEPEVSSYHATWCGLGWEVASGGLEMSLLNTSCPPCWCSVKKTLQTPEVHCLWVLQHALSFQPVEMAMSWCRVSHRIKVMLESKQL